MKLFGCRYCIQLIALFENFLFSLFFSETLKAELVLLVIMGTIGLFPSLILWTKRGDVYSKSTPACRQSGRHPSHLMPQMQPIVVWLISHQLSHYNRAERKITGQMPIGLPGQLYTVTPKGRQLMPSNAEIQHANGLLMLLHSQLSARAVLVHPL